MKSWHPASWQTKSSGQQPHYPSQQAVTEVIAELSELPPLVTQMEIMTLKEQLALAAAGKAFILQGGDCAESFKDCRAELITTKLKILLQMSLVLIYGLRKPVIRIGRIAGQYAKPRSDDMETQNGITLPSYRGDLVNQPPFTEEARTPDPKNMLKGYHYAALTLNYLRALVDGGFADLHHTEYWNLAFAQLSPKADAYQKLAKNITDALDFLHIIPGTHAANLQAVDFFTSHEALLLPYEQALTRLDTTSGHYYNHSTHMPWIGMRTAKLEDGHVEYMRGIANPIGVKIGPTMSASWLTQLVETLNPNNEAGRLVLIHRMGAEQISDALPALIETVKATGILVVWSSDPMHGNTQKTKEGIKTRRFDDILSELRQAFAIHQQAGTHLGGVHFEMTGEDVTECTGGARGITDADLQRAYKSLVDPRLNYEQALEMAMLICQEC